MIECCDLAIAGRGLDMEFKLAGDYAPQQIEVISPVEIRALIASIMILNEGGYYRSENGRGKGESWLRSSAALVSNRAYYNIAVGFLSS